MRSGEGAEQSRSLRRERWPNEHVSGNEQKSDEAFRRGASGRENANGARTHVACLLLN